MDVIKQFTEQVLYLFLESCPYMLLGIVIVFVLRIGINPDFFYSQLGGEGIKPICKAIIWGLPLPICSCGVIPLADFLYKNKVKRGVIGAFLVATPTNGIDSILVTYGILGLGFSIIRPIAGGVIAILVGICINYCYATSTDTYESTRLKPKRTWKARWDESVIELESFFLGTGRKFILGMLVISPLYFVLPNNIGDITYFGGNFFLYISMMLLGFPLYICSTSSVPIAYLLLQKGFSIGAAFTFLTAGPLTNLGVFYTMGHILGKRGLAIFYGVCSISILFFAYTLDQISLEWLNVPKLKRESLNMSHNISYTSWNQILCTGIFFGLFIWANRLFFGNLFTKRSPSYKNITLCVDGMVCINCELRIQKELLEVSGVTKIKASHKKRQVQIYFDTKDATKESIQKLQELGFDVREESSKN